MKSRYQSFPRLQYFPLLYEVQGNKNSVKPFHCLNLNTEFYFFSWYFLKITVSRKYKAFISVQLKRIILLWFIRFLGKLFWRDDNFRFIDLFVNPINYELNWIKLCKKKFVQDIFLFCSTHAHKLSWNYPILFYRTLKIIVCR